MNRLLPCAVHAAIAATVALTLAACSRGPDTPPAASPPAASAPGAAASGPPVSVTTVVARQRDLPVVLEATGTTVPVASVEVRPQVTSVVTRVHVREGQFVRAGELLFTLDARADEANVAKMRAQMARDEASLADAERQYARARELLAQNFVSQGAVDTSQTLVESQRALVAADRAAVDAARVTLAYARVTAPAAGRIGAVPIYPGSAVQANQTTLATVTQLDPIDVQFTVPQRYLADALAALRSGAAVTALLPEGGGRRQGRLQFVDNAVDAASGSVKVKARFDNADSRLWPGAFVKASMTLRTLEGAVVIPQAAVVQGPRGTVAYAVEDGHAVLRPVQVQATEGDDAAVSGVRVGERLVVDGRQNLRPGAAVVERTRDAARPGAAASAAGAASAPAP